MPDNPLVFIPGLPASNLRRANGRRFFLQAFNDRHDEAQGLVERVVAFGIPWAGTLKPLAFDKRFFPFTLSCDFAGAPEPEERTFLLPTSRA